MSLERLGTGTQSAVIIGMMELVLRAGRGDAKFFAIEEPDAFIHPHGVRHLASLMRRNASEGSSQVMLSTHSPSLLATMRPGEIIRVEKRKGRTEAFQASGGLTDTFFGRYVNQNTAEIFFARRAVLVEGATETFLLPPLSPLVRQAGRNLDFGRSCISVVDIGGKSSLSTYLKLLHEYEIEAFAILDEDFLGDRSCSTTVKYLRGRGAKIDDASPDALRRDLAKLNIIVLSKGEIEDYIPEQDVVAASERDAATVHKLLSAHTKTSDAFKTIFRMGKPQYGQVLSDLYVSRGAIPSDLERLISKIGS
jgi:predicted ATP-dependent endonuclease of OLD family